MDAWPMAALRRAYEAHRLRLVRLGTLLVGDQVRAEDLVHDVFLRGRKRLGELEESAVYPYLRRALANAWRNQLRHREVEARILPRLRVGDSDHVEVADRLDLWRAILDLPDRQRAVLVLRYYEDLTDEEIARILGCARVTVRSQAKRALDKLREVVEA